LTYSPETREEFGAEVMQEAVLCKKLIEQIYEWLYGSLLILDEQAFGAVHSSDGG
jgi:hypothetical protein